MYKLNVKTYYTYKEREDHINSVMTYYYVEHGGIVRDSSGALYRIIGHEIRDDHDDAYGSCIQFIFNLVRLPNPMNVGVSLESTGELKSFY